jgi:hypothetical protein
MSERYAGSRDVNDADPQELPLREALIWWCNPVLVQRIQLVEEIVDITDSERAGLPRLSDSFGDPKRWSLERYAGVRVHNGTIKPTGVLFEAWKRLEADFRRRIEQGEIHLAGVSTWPLRETERRPIPNLWAADLVFDFRNSLVNVVQYQYSTHRYVAVTASLKRHVAQPQAPVAAAPPIPARDPVLVKVPGVALEEAGDAVSVSDPALPKRKDRGRMNYGPLIEAVLRENWDDIARRYPPPTKPVWTEVARMLRSRMTKRHARNPQAIVPQLDTFRTNLPDIYAKVLSEKADLNKSNQ